MNYNDFDLACQRAIMEMVIPGLAHLYKEVKFYWPISSASNSYIPPALINDNYDFTQCEITSRTGDNLALICFENSSIIVYNFSDFYEKFSIDMSDPDIHFKAFDYLEELIKSIV